MPSQPIGPILDSLGVTLDLDDSDLITSGSDIVRQGYEIADD